MKTPAYVEQFSRDVDAALTARGFSGFTITHMLPSEHFHKWGVGVEICHAGVMRRHALLGSNNLTVASAAALIGGWLAEIGIRPGACIPEIQAAHKTPPGQRGADRVPQG